MDIVSAATAIPIGVAVVVLGGGGYWLSALQGAVNQCQRDHAETQGTLKEIKSGFVQHEKIDLEKHERIVVLDTQWAQIIVTLAEIKTDIRELKNRPIN